MSTDGSTRFISVRRDPVRVLSRGGAKADWVTFRSEVLHSVVRSLRTTDRKGSTSNYTVCAFAPRRREQAAAAARRGLSGRAHEVEEARGEAEQPEVGKRQPRRGAAA